MTKWFSVKKLTLAAVLTALGVVLGTFAFPVGASKCAPLQHFINVVCGITLGPVYSVCVAFCISLIRNLLGTGSLLAFPGSMIGALFAGLLYRFFKKDEMAVLGELIGTGFIGAYAAYWMATLVIGKQDLVVYAYVVPFIVSSLGGCVLAYIAVKALRQTKVLNKFTV